MGDASADHGADHGPALPPSKKCPQTKKHPGPYGPGCFHLPSLINLRQSAMCARGDLNPHAREGTGT